MSWEFGLLFEISNFVDKFWTVSDRVLILHMSIACSKNFPCVNILTLWPLLWSLAYFEVFNPVNSFKTVSAWAVTFHLNISCDKTYVSVSTNKLLPFPLDLGCWPAFCKVEVFIFHMNIPGDKISLLVLYLLTLICTFFEKLTLVMILELSYCTYISCHKYFFTGFKILSFWS